MRIRRNAKLTLLIAGVGILAAVLSASAQERVISFSKDIDVLPNNDNHKTRINVRLEVDKTRVNPGDTITIRFQTDQDAFVRLIDKGTSGKITCLWPNQFSGPDNFVKAGRWYSFPSPTDRFRFRVSGPEGLEKIVAVASAEKNMILRDDDFTDFRQGFQSYSKSLKDLVVESSQRVDKLSQNVDWGTAEQTLVIGRGPSGGSITSERLFVLSVGAATGKLRYCDDDATKFSRLVSGSLRVPQENIRVVTGRSATKDGIGNAIGWLSSRTSPQDLVFIYFSGHGTQVRDAAPRDESDGLDEAFVCYHSKGGLTLDDPDLPRILLLDDEFGRYLKQVPARRKIVVVDSCHSGTIHKSFDRNLVSKYEPLLPPSLIKQLQIVTTGSTGAIADGGMAKAKVTILSACADSESSFEDRSKRSGLFTYWLTNHLQSGGDLASAFDKARRQVMDEATAANLRQTPQMTDEYGLARDIRF